MRTWTNLPLFGALLCISSPLLEAQTNLGMVGLRSVWNRYLQAHYPEGEMHSSNAHRNEEETWFLVEVDKTNNVYALYNWRNGLYISHKHPCAPASSTVLGPHEQWIMVSGKPYGFLNVVALKAKDNGTFLQAGPPGNDTSCGGEVNAWDQAGPKKDAHWASWWVIEPATTPTPGRDFWNTVGGAVGGVLTKINPADIVKLLAAVGGGGGGGK